jgi:hypothetical protein
MDLSGLHLLLTYLCNFECDHCFVWGSPWQSGTMTLRDIRSILDQGNALGTVEWIYFEGGEAFLYYPVLVRGVQESARRGFQVGIVTNSYWATSKEDAMAWLEPLAGMVQDLSISSDMYHSNSQESDFSANARAAAEALDIPLGVISIAQPEAVGAMAGEGQLALGESGVMYRGRAAEALVAKAVLHPWESFQECPYEDLRQPGRVHIDPGGNVHLCQGLTLGNMFQTPLAELCEKYDAGAHPVVGPLLSGGPAQLVREYRLAHQQEYADACHLCYTARQALRQQFPDTLAPDQMYGIMS